MRKPKWFGKESTGTAIAVVVFGWLWVESTYLSGESVSTAPVHPIGVPLVFEVTHPGEVYASTIGRGNSSQSGNRRRLRKGKKLSWQLVDPNGQVVLADDDRVAKQSRFVKFTPTVAGQHTLNVDWNNSGFFKRYGLGYITLLVNRDDRSVVMKWLHWLW